MEANKTLLIIILSAVVGHGLYTRTLPVQDSLESCKREFLITIEDKSEGIEISAFPNGHSDGKNNNPEVQTSIGPLPLSDQHVSEWCGRDLFRCQNLLVETSPMEMLTMKMQYILFLPLEDHLHLVELVYNGSSIRFGTNHKISTPSCSPTAVYKLGNGFYVVCVNSEENLDTISLHEVRLNKTMLSMSTFVPMAIAEYHFPSGLIANASNYLFVEWNQDVYIYFAVNNALYAIRPFRGEIEDDFESIGASCRHVNELALTGNDNEILAYCDDFLIYYDVGLPDWTLQDTYDHAGRPYICPDESINLSVFLEEHYITYNIDSHKVIEEIPDSFHSGVCFGAKNNSLFAYVDRESGLFVLDTITTEVQQISSLTCPNNDCEPLNLAENRYLILQQKSDDIGGRVVVFDSQRNFSVVMEARHTTPDLMTLAHGLDLECVNKLNMNDSDMNPVPRSNADLRNGVIGAVVAVIVVAIIIAGIIVVVAIIAHKKKKTVHFPIEEVTRYEQSDEKPGGSTPPPPSYKSTIQSEASATGRHPSSDDAQEITPVEEKGHTENFMGPVGNQEGQGIGMSEKEKAVPEEASGSTLRPQESTESEGDFNHDDTRPLLHVH